MSQGFPAKLAPKDFASTLHSCGGRHTSAAGLKFEERRDRAAFRSGLQRQPLHSRAHCTRQLELRRKFGWKNLHRKNKTKKQKKTKWQTIQWHCDSEQRVGGSADERWQQRVRPPVECSDRTPPPPSVSLPRSPPLPLPRLSAHSPVHPSPCRSAMHTRPHSTTRRQLRSTR